MKNDRYKKEIAELERDYRCRKYQESIERLDNIEAEEKRAREMLLNGEVSDDFYEVVNGRVLRKVKEAEIKTKQPSLIDMTNVPRFKTTRELEIEHLEEEFNLGSENIIDLNEFI